MHAWRTQSVTYEDPFFDAKAADRYQSQETLVQQRLIALLGQMGSNKTYALIGKLSVCQAGK